MVERDDETPDETPDGTHDGRRREEPVGGPDVSPADVWPEEVWARLIEWLRPVVRRVAGGLGLPVGTADEAQQEALARLLGSPVGDRMLRGLAESTVDEARAEGNAAAEGEALAPMRGWLVQVARRLLLDVKRGYPGPIGHGRPVPEAAAWQRLDHRAAKAERPLDVAIRRDLWRCAPRLIDRLPPPCRQIAIRRYLLLWSVPATKAWLVAWRDEAGEPVSPATARWWIRQTRKMLRALFEGEDIRDRWPKRFGKNSRNSAWFTAPPPPLARL